jgi:glycosyltransferase involved in cell wall biosynthesis
VGNVSIHRMGFGIPKIDGIILALFGHFCTYKLMRKNTYDFVWSIMASYGAFAAVRVKKKTGLPLLLTLQEGDSFEHIYERVKWVRTQFNEIFTHADAIQAISAYLLKWGQAMGYQGNKGRVIPNGVAIDVFSALQSPEEILRMRESFGFPKDAFIIMTSSRLEKKNGIADVISALSKLPPDVCFVVCGSGSLEDAMHAQVETFGLSARVKFMGFVDPKELPHIMRACDCFIRPSLTEGLGNAFLEAMAARLPVIGTNAGGIPDFLTDGETGYMVGIEDPDSIIRAVDRMRALSPEDKEALLDRAFSMVRERYDWDLITVEMEKLFNDVTV